VQLKTGGSLAQTCQSPCAPLGCAVLGPLGAAAWRTPCSCARAPPRAPLRSRASLGCHVAWPRFSSRSSAACRCGPAARNRSSRHVLAICAEVRAAFLLADMRHVLPGASCFGSVAAASVSCAASLLRRRCARERKQDHGRRSCCEAGTWSRERAAASRAEPPRNAVANNLLGFAAHLVQAAPVPASAQQIVRVFRRPGLSEAKSAALVQKVRGCTMLTASVLLAGQPTCGALRSSSNARSSRNHRCKSCFRPTSAPWRRSWCAWETCLQLPPGLTPGPLQCFNIAVTSPLTAAEKDVLMWCVQRCGGGRALAALIVCTQAGSRNVRA